MEWDRDLGVLCYRKRVLHLAGELDSDVGFLLYELGVLCIIESPMCRWVSYVLLGVLRTVGCPVYSWVSYLQFGILYLTGCSMFS